MKKSKITQVAIKRLQLNKGQIEWLPRNPRQWTQTDIDKMVRSLERDPDFVEERPVLATPGKGDALVVFAHNLLTESAKRAGQSSLPVVVYTPEDDDDRETIRRRALLDNGAMGRNDPDILANEWPYEMEELVDFGYPDFSGETETKAETPQAQEDDFDEESDAVETRCQPGDIWQLGNHRLMCGDSTDAASVALLMNGEKADLLLTDPPYGIDYGGMLKGVQKRFGWKNYDAPEWDKNRPDKLAFNLMLNTAKEQIIWGGNYFTEYLPPKMCWLVWDKGQRDFSLADGELAWTSFEKALRIFSYARALANREDKVHPTQKPIALLEWCLNIAERNMDVSSVVDLFAGSGSTIIACEQTGKKCFSMELDPHYCDVILARWEKLTGQTAHKID